MRLRRDAAATARSGTRQQRGVCDRVSLVAAAAREERHASDVFHRAADVGLPGQDGLDFGATALMFSNKHFDPVAGSRLYNEYLDHYLYAEEMGVEGMMLNEHHNAPFCMQAKAMCSPRCSPPRPKA